MEMGWLLLTGRAPGVDAKIAARDRATDGFSATLSTIGGAMMLWRSDD